MGLTKREAFLVFNLLPNIGPTRVRSILKAFDNKVLDIFISPKSKLDSLIGKKFSELIFYWEKFVDLKSELERIRTLELELVTLDDADYPVILEELYDAPLCLYLRGSKKCLSQKEFNLAIVGSRRASNYAIDTVKKIAEAACRQGCQIISGLAYGIDSIAHQVSVDNTAGTIAVMAHGLQHIYPKGNNRLYHKILEAGGLILSEFPTFFVPDRRYFPMRNRIISGLSQAVLIGQAGLKSGSLITARQALEQGREVFAIPGPVGDDFSGSHSLIKQGAKLVESFDDIVEEFSYLDFSSQKRKKQEFSLNTQEKKVIDLLNRDQSLDAETISEELGVPISEALVLLTNMEIKSLLSSNGCTYHLL